MAANKFWRLTSPDSTRKLAEWAEGEMGFEPRECPVHGPIGGKRAADLSIILPQSPIQDFVWTWYSECLVQDHVLDLLRAKGISGFELKPVKARFKKETAARPPRLRELVVTGWGGMAAPESGIRLLEQCDLCGYSKYSNVTNAERLIDESQWDRSDFFMVWPLPTFIFVTDRVAQDIRAAKWRGAQLTAVTEIKWVGRGFAPGCLSMWMPEARAKELGGPLGIA